MLYFLLSTISSPVIRLHGHGHLADSSTRLFNVLAKPRKYPGLAAAPADAMPNT
jgi:hypothetical protein